MSKRFCAPFAALLFVIGCCGFGGCGKTELELKSTPSASSTAVPMPDLAVSRLADKLDAGATEAIPAQEPEHNTETYDQIVENAFRRVTQYPLSTFSIDVDTASYANVRRFLASGQLPPAGAVRIEELINYFNYDYPQPQKDVPFSVNIEAAECPWQPAHRLVRIGLKGKDLGHEQRPVSNLVFLVDVSGSMQSPNRLPLVREGLKMLVRQLGENDRVSIAVYAGASGLVLPSTTCDRQAEILAAIDRLQAGGSTNGGAGIQLAYQTALENFIAHGTNRVILCTDGDFNVGVTNQSDLITLIEQKAQSKVFLTVLGFGMGNYKDSTLEKLADKGNGHYGYIDSLNEARKLFIEQMQGTLITIAKDVKIQVEFNPARVAAYRLVGYENRLLANEDFNDDRKDAGEIGAGHTVTALYEVVPSNGSNAGVVVGEGPGVDALKYQKPAVASEAAAGDELLTVKLRYKQPEGDESRLIEMPAIDRGMKLAEASRDFVWAAAVAEFGLVLRSSQFKGNSTLASVLELAGTATGTDPHGHRAEFLRLVQTAQALMQQTASR